MRKRGEGRVLRTKVVNLMYLIFIALAFFYIPPDFLDSATTLDKSLENNSEELNEEKELKLSIYRKSLQKISPYYDISPGPNFSQIFSLSDHIISKIDSLKEKLIWKGGGYDQYGYPESGRKYFLTQKHLVRKNTGEELRQLFSSYKKQMKSLVNDSFGYVIDSILDTRLKIRSSAGRMKKWDKFFFEKTPLNISLAHLSKFQNDVRHIEFIVTSYYQKKIVDNNKLKLAALWEHERQNRQLHLVSRSGERSYLGEEVIVFLNNFKNLPKSHWSKVKASVKKGDKMRAIPVDSQGIIRFYPSKNGTYTITIKTPNKTLTKEVKIESYEPKITRDKKEVLYMGINNYLKIDHKEFNNRKLKVRSPDANIIRRHDTFFAKVQKPGYSDFYIYGKNPNGNWILLGKRSYISKGLPKPEVYFNGQQGGFVPSQIFQRQDHLNIVSEKIRDNNAYSIRDFSLIRIHPSNEQPAMDQKEKVSYPSQTTRNQNTTGAYFNSGTKKLVNKAKRGDIYIFENIVVESADGNIRIVPSLVLKII